MEKIIVSDMMCIHCEKRIKEALENQNIKCEIILEKKEVNVEICDLKKAKDIISSLHYKVD